MCGICGILDRDGIDTRVLYEMTNIIRHRGPDDEGFYIENNNSKPIFLKGDDTVEHYQHYPHIRSIESTFILGLGHRRLSIIDLTYEGHQPLQSNSGNIIVYNGEVYNYIELKNELKALGYGFNSNTDSEVILNAYEEWGEECVNKFVGMWAFCIYDIRNKILFCSRDRYAIKPFYYTYTLHYFSFASEIKAFFKNPKIKKEVNHISLYQYITLGKIINSNDTLYAGINELPAGHNLIYNINDNSIQIKQYYDLSKEIQKSKVILMSESKLIEYYGEQLEESVKIHLRSDVEIGSCLSGGIDSSAIVYLINKINPGVNYKTFSAVFDNKEVDESEYIKELLGVYPNINGYFVTPTAEEFWKDFDILLWHQDLPIASSSIFAQWDVMKLAASKNIKVLLDGQGADEVLGGYSYFTGVYLLELIKTLRLTSFYREQKLIKENRKVSVLNELGRALSHNLPVRLQLYLRKKNRLGIDLLSENYSFYNCELNKLEPVVDYQEHSIEAVTWGLHSLLRYEDRNSMAFSIESRVPFLSHRLVELAIALPTNTKIKEGWTKYPLRKLIDGHVPQSIVWRKDKKGFVTPQREWIRKLRSTLKDYIEGANISEYFAKEKIIALLNRENMPSKQQSELWKIISIIKWLNMIENKS